LGDYLEQCQSSKSDKYSRGAFEYVTIHRGDVVRTLDQNGATVATYDYDPWGNLQWIIKYRGMYGKKLSLLINSGRLF